MNQLVAAAAYCKGYKVQDINLHEGKTWAAKPAHFVWIGLQHPDAATLRSLQTQFNLHELAIEDALQQHNRPKLETFGDALFLVLYAPVYSSTGVVFVETHIFAGNGYIISSRYGNSSSYTQVRQRCEARPLLLANGEDFVLYALLDFIVDNYRPITEAIHAKIEHLEQTILSQSLREADIEGIHALRRQLVRLHRHVAPMVDICQELQELSFPFIDFRVRPYFQDVAIHVNRLVEDIGILREIANQTVEMGLLLESARQSLVQRKFAAWAAMLAWPTAVAGVYGMNFQYMPELGWHYGYFAVLGVIGLGCGGLYANFRRLGWL